MPGTIRGLPYPLGTDKVVDGDDAIKALAQSIDSRPIAIASGSGTATTGGAVVANLAAIRDTHAMIAANRLTIPTGFGGVWLVSARVQQSASGTVGLSAVMRVVGGSALLADARTGASGASASPVLSGLITVTAGQQVEVLMTCASGTVGYSLSSPALTLMFVHD